MKNYPTRTTEKGRVQVRDIENTWRDALHYQKSLDDWPSFAQKVMGNDGRMALTSLVSIHNECGCQIVGCGTLQFPMTIDFCKKHSD